MADIFICTLDRSEVIQFPTLPEEFPSFALESKSEEFSSFNNGDYNLQNGVKLLTFSLGCTLPQKQYPFCRAPYTNTNKILSMMANSMRNGTPVRFVFIGNLDLEIINITVTCEKLEWNYNRQLDSVFKADFKEYKEV